MAQVKDVLVYLLANYPYPEELSNARVNKMVYLADWKHCIEHGRQVTPIQWHFHNFGPYVEHIKRVVISDPKVFAIRRAETTMGDSKTQFQLVVRSVDPDLAESEKDALDHVIKTTSPLNFSDFIHLVYSTYPVASSARYTDLDLVAMAKEYKEHKRKLRQSDRPLAKASG